VPLFDPFVGLRYNLGPVRLNDVIAPPYDVIGSAERTRLASRSPSNSVLVELPAPDLAGGRDRYVVATALLARWRAEGVLVPDAAPALYPYRMTATDGRTSTGVIGALGLAVPGDDSDVLPHEETLPKPKSDRLDLLRATRTNLSPIWGLSLTPGLTAALDPDPAPPVADAFDDDGVRHQLWVLDDPDAVAAVRDAVGASPVVIADGHHRYETALAYQRERRAAGDASGPFDKIMAFVVELAPEQLLVGPIHRTVSGLPDGFDVAHAFSKWFDVVRAGDAGDRTVAALGDAQSLAYVTAEGAYLLTPREEAAVEAGSDLDSSLVALALRELPDHETEQPHSWEEAVAAVRSGQAQLAVLLRPATVDQISAWAAARRRMPPKTTYFWPKPRTGMVFRDLDLDGTAG
jgi:uncharacterized protein (DUF1015 family)